MPKLRDVLDTLESVDSEWVICAKKPWHAECDCVLVELNESLAVPDHVKTQDYEYFLEVHVALEVLEVLPKPSDVTGEDKTRLLIFYAENDAFPDWVYD